MAAMANKKSTSLTARLARWRIWVQGTFLFVWLAPMLRVHTVAVMDSPQTGCCLRGV